MRDKSKIHPKRWNYLGGLMDGDGSFTISAHPHEANYINYDVHVGIASTHLPTVKWVQDVFGGQYYVARDKRKNRKLRYNWYVSNSAHQLSILMGVSGSLKLKNPQATALQEFIGLGGRYFQDPEVRKAICDFVQERNDFYVPVYRTKRDADKVTADKEDYQYLAGLIDAEGCISLYESRRSFDPKIQIANTDMRIFDFLLSRFGGSVSSCKRDNRECGNWVLPTRFLENSLLATLPYLVTKREQAKILLEWFRHRKSYTDEETREIIDKFRVLNLRGTSLTTNTAACPENGQMTESDLAGDRKREPAVMLVS